MVPALGVSDQLKQRAEPISMEKCVVESTAMLFLACAWSRALLVDGLHARGYCFFIFNQSISIRQSSFTPTITGETEARGHRGITGRAGDKAQVCRGSG